MQLLLKKWGELLPRLAGERPRQFPVDCFSENDRQVRFLLLYNNLGSPPKVGHSSTGTALCRFMRTMKKKKNLLNLLVKHAFNFYAL